jgi:hypothetical protein
MRVSRIIALAGLGVIAAGFASAEPQLPQQKAGLWQTSMTMAGRPFSTLSCVTAESAAKMSVFSSQMRQKNCSSSSITHNMDGSWTSTSICKFGPGATHANHAHITGDMNSKFIVDIAADSGKTPETTMTMTWLGECKPGMKGGDVVMSNGTKMNVLDATMSSGRSH